MGTEETRPDEQRLPDDDLPVPVGSMDPEGVSEPGPAASDPAEASKRTWMQRLKVERFWIPDIHHIRNLTMDRLEIALPGDKHLFLAPLQQLRWEADDEDEERRMRESLAHWQDHGLVKLVIERRQPAEKQDHSDATAALGCLPFLVISILVGVFTSLSLPWKLILIGGSALFPTIFLLSWTVKYIARLSRTGRLRPALDFLRDLPRVLRERMALVAALIVAFGVPLLAHFLSGSVVWAPTLEETWYKDLHAVLRCTLAVTAAVFPALLFFVRATDRLETVRERFYREIMLLDPRIDTLADALAYYDEELVEVFGPQDARRVHQHRGTVLPVIGCTFVLALGWTLALLYSGHVDGNQSGLGVVTDALAPPHASPVVAAFLGAYFFGLGMVLRGHLRGDLDPKSFNSLNVRIFLVVILAWVLESVPDLKFIEADTQSATVALFAFFTGIFPESALTWIQEQIRHRAPGLVETIPLTDLEGIDLYDRSRLSDEGINNVEALAHHDLVHLMLRTRIPAARLVDWVDQAVLYLHADYTPEKQAGGGPRAGGAQPRAVAAQASNGEAAGDASEAAGEAAAEQAANGEGQRDGADTPTDTIYRRLRRAGIRSATDLESAFFGDMHHVSAKSGELSEADKAARAALQRIVGSEGDLIILMRAIRDDEWLEFIRTRKRRLERRPRLYKNPHDFRRSCDQEYIENELPPTE